MKTEKFVFLKSKSRELLIVHAYNIVEYITVNSEITITITITEIRFELRNA